MVPLGGRVFQAQTPPETLPFQVNNPEQLQSSICLLLQWPSEHLILYMKLPKKDKALLYYTAGSFEIQSIALFGFCLANKAHNLDLSSLQMGFFSSKEAFQYLHSDHEDVSRTAPIWYFPFTRDT